MDLNILNQGVGIFVSLLKIHFFLNFRHMILREQSHYKNDLVEYDALLKIIYLKEILTEAPGSARLCHTMIHLHSQIILIIV